MQTNQQQQLQNSIQPSYGWGAVLQGLAGGITAGVQQKKCDYFRSLPPAIAEAVFQPYKYQVNSLAVSKTIRLNAWLIDPQSLTVYSGTHEVHKADSFEIAYDINDADTQAVRTKYSSEDDVSAYEHAKESIDIEKAMADILLSKKVKSQPYKRWEDAIKLVSAEPLRLASSSPASQIAQIRTSNPGQRNDPRFLSVVIVENPRGSMGTGFFVTPHELITNYHVVDGAKFVQIKLLDGRQALANVIKTDLGRDLALLKTQETGVPVKFAQSPPPQGEMVEALGHPEGLYFSITRGIVSAVRTWQSARSGNIPTLVIQTDAAINPGNSGGPLFIKDQVIGVNSFGYSSTLTAKKGRISIDQRQGLNFAIHYLEVQKFIAESQ